MIIRISSRGCPVCGYPDFDALDEHGCTTFDICPCCGGESGYEYQAEVDAEHLQRLRQHWYFDEGGRWTDSITRAPENWDARTQLERAGLRCDTKVGTMNFMDVYGFQHEDLRVARKAIERALSVQLEEAAESYGPGSYFRWYVPDGPCVQVCSNEGSRLRWGGEPPEPWYPDYPILVFVHGSGTDSIAESLRHEVPGLKFLENKRTM